MVGGRKGGIETARLYIGKMVSGGRLFAHVSLGTATDRMHSLLMLECYLRRRLACAISSVPSDSDNHDTQATEYRVSAHAMTLLYKRPTMVGANFNTIGHVRP